MNFKDKDQLRLDQLERLFRPLRSLLGQLKVPRRGWIYTIQRALGMTNVQLAKRLGVKPQTLEDMQAYEVLGTVKLETLRKIAQQLDCRLVYALVPNRSLEDIRRTQARKIATEQLRRASHSMKLEDQGVARAEEEKELNRLIEKLLAADPKKLWQ